MYTVKLLLEDRAEMWSTYGNIWNNSGNMQSNESSLWLLRKSSKYLQFVDSLVATKFRFSRRAIS